MNKTSTKAVKCSICGEWMMPWLICEDTNHCPYYDEGDVGR